MELNLHYNKQDLIDFQIGRYVEVYSVPDDHGERYLRNIGTIVGIQQTSTNEIAFEVKLVLYPHRPVNDVYLLHPCYLKLIGA